MTRPFPLNSHHRVLSTALGWLAAASEHVTWNELGRAREALVEAQRTLLALSPDAPSDATAARDRVRGLASALLGVVEGRT